MKEEKTEINANDKTLAPATLKETFSRADNYDIFLMTVGTIAAVGSGVMMPISNVLFGDIMDELNGDPDTFQNAINKVCIQFVVVGGITLICGYYQVVFWTTAGERQAQKFREAYVHSILSQEVGWFDTNSPSTLSTKVADLVGKVQDGMGRKFGDFIFNIVQFFASIIISFYLSWKLSLVLLVSIPAVMAAGYYLVMTVTAAQQEALSQYAKAGGLASQTFGAIRTVNALNVQPSVISQYRRYLYEAMIVGIRKGVNVGLGNGALYGALFLTNALCYWYGGELVADAAERNCFSDRCVSGGDVMAVFFCLIMGSMALGQAVPPLTTFSSARIAVSHILETINRKPLINSLSDEGLKPDIKCRGDIEIKNLEFAYPSRPNLMVCKNYSLSIKAGETVAFVGASGCGKSTVINLLLRFYDPTSGSITIDNYDVKELNIRWLRSQIGYIGQEPALFPGSIAENIAHGLSDVGSHEILSSRKSDDGSNRSRSDKKYLQAHSQQSHEELMARIVEAAKMANAHDFIMRLPQQYDTDVGSNGMLLSGGQKQRLAIARALIKKPGVLLLDEATSALDAASERVVQQSIDSLATSKSQTIIIIAHRLSTIRNADKICLIYDGRIAEMGRHEELLALNGRYADLVSLQLGDDAGNASTVASPTEKEGALALDTAALEEETPAASKDTKEVKVSEKKESVKEEAVPEEVSKERSKDLSRRIWGLIFRYPSWFLWGFFGALVFGAIFPLWGFMISKTQEMFYREDPDEIRRLASQYGLYYILFAVVSFLSSTIQYAGLLGMGEKIAIYLRSEMFEALLRRDMGFFDDEKNSVGSLTTALADDCRLVNRAFSESFARQMQALCNLAVSLALSFSASWKITLVVLATFPLVIGSSAVQMQAVTASQYEDVSEDKQNATAAAASSPSKTPTTPSKNKSQRLNDDKGHQVVPQEEVVEDEKKKNLLAMAGGPGAIISTAFTQIRTVSAFSMHQSLSEQYNELTQLRSQVRVDRSIWGGIGFGGSNAIQFWIYALLFWYGAILMRRENLSFVNLMISIFALMMGALGLGQALSDMGDQKAAFLAADRIFRCIDEGKQSSIDGLSTNGVTPSAVAALPSTAVVSKPASQYGSRIIFDHVFFRYPTRPGIEVCRDYNFTIEAGETVAFVGPSGSGKSTIINLLLRFYDPLQGRITFDGHDLRTLNVRWVRSRCGYVGQEAVLFPGSVEENIARGRSSNITDRMLTLDEAVQSLEQDSPDNQNASLKALIPCWPLPKDGQQTMTPSSASGVAVPINKGPEEGKDGNGDVELGSVKSATVAEDVLAASRAAHSHDFIHTFPQGYATNVGEGSIMVSGGQKQRIAIARALIKQPSVLLLDEATSALDANSERLVQQSIDELAAADPLMRPTTIIIAHRLSTIRNADKICVVDQGAIVEMGRHDELLSLPDGLYRQLWEKQQGTHSSMVSPAKN